jgi:hypothetical protein
MKRATLLTIVGGVGRDEAYGTTGDDTIRMVGDTDPDFVNCGEDPSGTDIDTAQSAATIQLMD